MITIYTRPGCGQCTATKRQLSKAGVPYQEIVVNSEIADDLRADGWTALPVVIPTRGTPWQGFKPAQITNLTTAK